MSSCACFHLALLECEDHLDVGQLHVQVAPFEEMIALLRQSQQAPRLVALATDHLGSAAVINTATSRKAAFCPSWTSTRRARAMHSSRSSFCNATTAFTASAERYWSPIGPSPRLSPARQQFVDDPVGLCSG